MSKKGKEKTNERVSKRDQRRLELNQQRQRRNRLFIGVGLIIVAVLAFLIVRQLIPIEGVVDYGAEERTHDAQASYPFSPMPPVGGAHRPTWQNCGIYEQPVEVSFALHSMEHGGVWIAYQPEIGPEAIAQLQTLARTQPLVLLAPYPGLEEPVVVTGWGRQLTLPTASDPRLERFVSRYRGQGPEAGAICTGGVGNPTG